MGRILFTSNNILDTFIGGFSSAKITLLDSSDEFVFDMVPRLIVIAVGTFNEDVVAVDGGNSINPYVISHLSRIFKLNVREVLAKVHIARAFTAYQMDTLLEESLSEIVEKYSPSTVIISCISHLFLDRDVNRQEACALLKSALSKINELTAAYNLITILTDYSSPKSSYRSALKRLFYEKVNAIIKIKRPSKKKLRFILNGRMIDYYPIPLNQLTLDDFI
jgi:hypothetical protein